MSKLASGMLVCLLLLSFVAGCAPAAPAAAPQQVEVTRVVEKEVPVEVTRVVEVEKEAPAEPAEATTEGAEAAAPAAQTWEVINPQGVIDVEPAENAARPDTLDGKTIVLRWNGKHNGDNFLDRIAELLAEQVPTAKVIKFHEEDPSVAVISGSNATSEEFAKKIAAVNPDIVIASQAD